MRLCKRYAGSTGMNNNFEIFNYHLTKLESILSMAQSEENPAPFLYQNDGRTPLFMLEGLSRLYGNLHNKNKFEKLKNQFKVLEDALGSIDYYDVYSKSYKNRKDVPESIQNYMEQQRDLMFQNLNLELKQRGWISDSSNRIKKMRKVLKEIDWFSPKKEITEIKKVYLSTIVSIQKFIEKTGNPFTQMELQVHEVRRDLRWLSIYPHALRGKIQYGNEEGSTSQVAPYATEEIRNSKYNLFPNQTNEEWVLLLEKNYFFALSWLIAEIGKLKDEGLEYYALLEAFIQTENLTEPDAILKTLKILNWNDSKFNSLLASASEITNHFIQNGFLDKLVFGVSRTKRHKR